MLRLRTVSIGWMFGALKNSWQLLTKVARWITAVEMRFLQCDASFQLDSVESFCRQPAILAYAATFVFIGSVASFGVALFLRIRGKEIS